MSSSDEDQPNEIDCDTCNTSELSKLFGESLRITSEEAISLQKDYVLYLDNSRDFGRIAASTSSNSVHLFDLNSDKGFTQIQRCDIDSINYTEDQTICGIRFGKEDVNTLLVAAAHGKVYRYDLRSKPMPVQTFENVDANQKPFMCFDVNADDSVLSIGTEQHEGEANLLLFDVRKVSSLAVYSDSHRDDLTQIHFHPSKSNILASGSVDGLINVFNILESNEDDALENSLNTESSIQTINWHPKVIMQIDDEVAGDFISCITHTNDFQLFDVDECEQIFECERKKITKLIKRSSVSDCYLINCHTTAFGDIILLAGSNFNGGECLRSLTLHEKSFKPRNNFTDNKQIIRCSVFNPKDNTLITGGEGGIVTVWGDWQPKNIDTHKLKEKVTTKKNRKSTPY
ncbi:WD repeat-containing protein 89 [Contarinia nasturtii]|uniref:WD repeat-containing protein 89 n=1 Tax=Contarinia nasturtii TaxID=265458 RepID=UPI0012D43228|nr:WD repeat-containing protein 89 [Contarinia nasturtii]